MYSWNREIINNYYNNELDSVACDVLEWTYSIDNGCESSLSDRAELEKAALDGRTRLMDEFFISSMIGTNYKCVKDIIRETNDGYEVCLYTCLEVVGQELAELKASRVADCKPCTGCGYLTVESRGHNLVLVKLRDVLEELCHFSDEVRVVLVCTNGAMSIHTHKRGG